MLVMIKILGFAALSITIAAVSISYKNTVKQANEKLAGYKAAAVSTTYGKMSYIDKGEGEPLLIVHGICGGYDQGFEFSRFFLDAGFRLISPSRFGYPGSDLPHEATPKNQADAFKQLLDKLGIEKAIVVATSAGGGPGLRFALNYPERTKGLILISANVPTPSIDYKNPPDFIYNDFPMWAALKTNRSFFLNMFGVDKKAYKSAPEREKRGLDGIFNTILPMKQRRPGILNENKVTNPDTSKNYNEYTLEEIKVPVLFVHAKNDPMAKYPGVEAAWRRIPGAKMVAFEDGGHLLFGHSDESNKAMIDFIREIGR